MSPVICLTCELKLEDACKCGVQCSVKEVQNIHSQPNNSGDASVVLNLLGSFQLFVDGNEAKVSARKSQALLAYLAIRIDEDVPRDTLAGLLWSERSSDQARASLRQCLSSVRKSLGSAASDVLSSTPATVRLKSERVWVDRHAIAADPASAGAEYLRTAADLFRGEFLEGVGFDEPEFDYWLSSERASVRSQRSALLTQLVSACEQDKQLGEALRFGTMLLSLDPLQEHMQRVMMRLFAAQGRYDAALSQFEQLKRELASQLDVLPEQSTLDLQKSIKAQRRRSPQTDTQVGTPPIGKVPRETVSDASPSPEKPSVAVLPFVNLSGDPEQEYFCDGITGDIITELSKFRTIFVVARHSSFAFKGIRTDLNDVAEKLGVQYICEGTVRRAGAAVRITAQLVEAETGHHLWAERFDVDIDNIFDVQDEVTRKIVAILPGRVQENVAERASRTSPANMKAYEYLLQGKQLRDSLSAEDNAKARDALEKSRALDPACARTYMYLADTYVVDLWLGLADDDASGRSMELARKGAGMDNSDVYIQDQLGFALLCEGLWDDAETQFDHTLSRIVNEAESMAWCGYAFLLLGHHKKAHDIVIEATRLDPLHAPALNWVLGQAHFFAGNYGEAARTLVGEALLNSLAHAFLVSAYANMDRMVEAENALRAFVRVRRGELESRNIAVQEDTISGLAGAYKRMWRHEADWERLADGLRKAGLPDGG